MAKLAFKCKSCGNFEEDGNQGDQRVPAACRICGAGVKFDERTGIKSYDTDNWIVLSDLPDHELTALLKPHKLEPSDIHKTKGKPEEPVVEAEPV